MRVRLHPSYCDPVVLQVDCDYYGHIYVPFVRCAGECSGTGVFGDRGWISGAVESSDSLMDMHWDSFYTGT